MSLLVRARYIDFGPTLVREKLLERHNTNRRNWMVQEEIWVSRKKKEKRVYQRKKLTHPCNLKLNFEGNP